MAHCLYMVTSPSGKSYIGMTHNFRIRMRGHEKTVAKGKTIFQKSIKKYGWENLEKKILVVGEKEFIADLEIKAIASFNTLYPNGYNTSPGGEISPMCFDYVREKLSKTNSGKPMHPETKKALIKANVGRVISKETREKISAAQKGKPREMTPAMWEGIKKTAAKTKGIPKSKEHVAKVAAALKGKKLSEEHAAKARIAAVGNKHSEEWKKKASERNCEKGNPFYGKKHSEDSKLKMSKAKFGKKMPAWTEERRAKVAAAWQKKREMKADVS